MDLTTLTLSVLVKKINRSNSSGDGFYTVHQCLSIGLTSVQPDSNYICTHTLDATCSEARRSRSTRCCSRAVSDRVSLSVGSFKIGRSLLSFLKSFGDLCEKYTLLQNIMQYFIDPCKFSHPSDLLVAGSNNPGTYRNSAYCLRAQQQILPDMRA